MSNGSRSSRKGTKYNFGASPGRGRGGSKKKKKGKLSAAEERSLDKMAAKVRARRSAKSKAVGNPSAAPINRGAGSKSVGAFIGPNPKQKGRTKKDRSFSERHKLIHRGTGATEKKITSQYQQRTGKSEGVYRTGDKRKAETQKFLENMYHPHTQRPRPTGGERVRTVKSKDPRTGKVTTKRVNYGRHKGRG